MKLHHNQKVFFEIVRAASQYLGIKNDFVEKDYWITLVLWRLSESSFATGTVFKGGTSLSKAYHLIDRFSEDVDISIMNTGGKSGNTIKSLIRTVEKEITQDLTEIQIEGVTSKGSMFRKSVWEFQGYERNNGNNRLMVEVNAFANPFPFENLPISSFLYDFLNQTGMNEYIGNNNLAPFTINVLRKEQTLLEKLVALLRLSFHENPIQSLSGKIRHFYDIYFLMTDYECLAFVNSSSFPTKFHDLLQHDKATFDEPLGWQSKTIYDSPLINDFESSWEKLKNKYKTELSAYSYRTIPDEASTAETFRNLTARLL